ncbi:hypothetical protein, partial [Bacteroides sp.]|uniref:hypothetical protein n=1 Tax=Bacteroides sp. TaxID=29523 RepID=UPI00261E8814
MLQNFNVFGEYEIPNVSVCYPNRKKIGDLGRITDLSLDLKFNTYSEITIKVPYMVDGVITPHYDKLVQKNKIHIDGYGYFIIQDISEDNDGVNRIKTIPAYSEEYSFNYRSINFLEGTYKFYDTSPSVTTIMSTIMEYIPNWTLGSVSQSLWTKYRTFNTTNDTLYSFMVSTVSKACECFFVFDTENRVLYVKDTTDIVNPTPIHLSHENLIKDSKINEKSDEFVTALAVTGGGGLDIRTVNPLGTDFIYDFSYIISSGQMSEDLSDAVELWSDKIDALQPAYASALAEYKTLNETMLLLDAQLTSLDAQITAKETVMQTRIEAGQTDLSDLAADIAIIQASKSAVESDITDTQADIDAKYAELTGISAELSFENNFTTEQYNELLDYIIESSYQNENIIKTSVMTNVEIQNQAQSLYDQGVSVLAKISQPRFEFSINSINFVFLKEYLSVTNLLTLGSTVNVEIDDSTSVTPILLNIKFNFYNPTDFTLTFGNRYRLDSSVYSFADLLEETLKKGSNIGVDSPTWNDWATHYQEDVSNFVSNSLDASKNRLINSTNQEVIIDEVGLRGKQRLENGSYSPEQVWLTKNTLAFTDDGWNTVKTALGKVDLGNGTTAYGLIADAIVTGVLYTELVRIFGTNDFYWDNDAIVLHYPSDENKEIRIGKYDGINYGIGFTTDGGSTWLSAIGFDGVVLQAGQSGAHTYFQSYLTPPNETSLQVGDLWIQTDQNNKMYRWSGSIWESVQDTHNDQAIIYLTENKTTIFYQDAQPTATATGDVWYDTNADPVVIYRWNGSSWVDITTAALSQALSDAADAQSTADGKIVTYAQSSAPTGGAYVVGDLWIDTDDDNKLYRYSGSAWVAYQANATALSTLTTSVSGKTTIFYQDAQPTATATGDVWYDTNADPVVIYRWNGSSWVDITTAALSQALSDAADAQSTADGKIVTYAQSSAPTAVSIGDLWIETDNNNALHRWNGYTWVSTIDTHLDSTVSSNTSAIETNTEEIALRVESTTYYKAVPIYSESAPNLTWTEQEKIDNIGFLWYQISTEVTWKWNGLAWINTTSINSDTDPSLAWSSAEKLANIGYLWGDTNGQSIVDYELTLPATATIQSAINYILICSDNTKIINTAYETVSGYYRTGDVVYCESV